MAAEPARVVESGPGDKVVLPPPYATRGVANSRIVAWPFAVWTDGSLLVSDDGANKIWRISMKR